MLELGLLAVALAMDAFAVALVRGCVSRTTWAECAIVGLAFGAAQGLMPLIGWGLGLAFHDLIASWDHWLVFAILGVLGVRLFSEGLEAPDADALDPATASMGFGALLIAAIATSVDAAAAGLTLDAFGMPVVLSCIVIALVTAILSFIGCAAGRSLGLLAGKRAELFGGIVLVALGTNLLFEHLAA